MGEYFTPFTLINKNDMKMIIRDTDMTIFFIGFFVGLEKYRIMDVFYNSKYQKWLFNNSTDSDKNICPEFDINGFITNVKFTPFENSIALIEVDFIEEEFRRLAFFDLTKLKSKYIRVIKTYERYLKEKLNQHQQFKAVIPDKDKQQHPKHDPNLWNNDCFELFKYLYDCYYKSTNRQLTNIWFYLKESGNKKYNLKATKDLYKDFIFEEYKIKITNFDKAQTKWEDKECNTIDDHRITFEDTLKQIAENAKNT